MRCIKHGTLFYHISRHLETSQKYAEHCTWYLQLSSVFGDVVRHSCLCLILKYYTKHGKPFQFLYFSLVQITEDNSPLKLHCCLMLRPTQKRHHLCQMQNTVSFWQTFQKLWLITWKEEEINGTRSSIAE